MKFNWGWGITLFLVVFMSFILQLVYRCTQQRVDLVSEKYYENEIKYQQRIDMEKNTASLIEDLNIQTKNGLMEINYPSLSGVRTGKITFSNRTTPASILWFLLIQHPEFFLRKWILPK